MFGVRNPLCSAHDMDGLQQGQTGLKISSIGGTAVVPSAVPANSDGFSGQVFVLRANYVETSTK